jgi:branched-chain amino acid aminotransferase
MSAMRYVILDFRIQRTGEARIGASSPALLHGDSLFETLPVMEAVPIFFDQHMTRLAHSMRALGFESVLDPDSMRSAVDNLLTGNLLEQGRLRLTVFRGLSHLGRSVDQRAEKAGLAPGEHVLIQLFPLEDLSPCAAGLARVNRRDFDPVSRHKTGNRLFYNLYRHWEGAHPLLDQAHWLHPTMPDEREVLFVDELDRLLEGTVSNLFLVIGGKALTPPRELGILPGVLRGRLLAEPVLGAGVEELILHDLERAEEAFMCNSMAGVRPLCRIGGRQFDTGAGPVTRRAMAALEEEVLKDLLPHLY